MQALGKEALLCGGQGPGPAWSLFNVAVPAEQPEKAVAASLGELPAVPAETHLPRLFQACARADKAQHGTFLSGKMHCCPQEKAPLALQVGWPRFPECALVLGGQSGSGDGLLLVPIAKGGCK